MCLTLVILLVQNLSCTTQRSAPTARANGNRITELSSAYLRGAKQAKKDAQAGIIALPHFFSEIGEAADEHTAIMEIIDAVYGVDYCSLGNGSGDTQDVSEFMDGYVSVSSRFAMQRFGNKSINQIYHDAAIHYRASRHLFADYFRLKEQLLPSHEKQGCNANRLWQIARGTH